jgi:hypothetical protein
VSAAFFDLQLEAPGATSLPAQLDLFLYAVQVAINSVDFLAPFGWVDFPFKDLVGLVFSVLILSAGVEEVDFGFLSIGDHAVFLGHKGALHEEVGAVADLDLATTARNGEHLVVAANAILDVIPLFLVVSIGRKLGLLELEFSPIQFKIQ